MKTYVAFLRGINVSGQKKIKMADLRDSLNKQGFSEVRTYIQSGNIVFTSKKSNTYVIAETIFKVIAADFGFNVPTLVLAAEEIERILNANPFQHEEEGKQYFVLLKSVPSGDLVREFNTLKFENEAFYITDNCVYLCCKTGYGKAKLSNNLVERKLKVEATARNLRTMKKLIEMTES